MIRIPTLVLAVFVLCQVSAFPEKPQRPDQLPIHPSIHLHPHFPIWTSFKAKHGKFYRTQAEELRRFWIFSTNHRKIEKHNDEFKAGRHSFQIGMNKFGDMTTEEFRARMNGLKRPENSRMPKLNAQIYKVPSNGTVPEAVDWRKEGYVAEVKDQGQCGSCWTFSATGALEGQHFKKTGQLVSLSEQNLVDCDRDDAGCNGGFMDGAFEYVHKNKGIDTEKSYPYEAKDGKCRFKAENVGATDTGHANIPEGDETALVSAIANVGPISVAIDASSFIFQFYQQGVYYDPFCSATHLDHGVLAVGYGTTAGGKKYYIIKNSWGEDWGDNGYILMSRERKNNCGVATNASYPTV